MGRVVLPPKTCWMANVRCLAPSARTDFVLAWLFSRTHFKMSTAVFVFSADVMLMAMGTY